MILLIYISIIVFACISLVAMVVFLTGRGRRLAQARKRQRLTEKYVESLYMWAYNKHIDRNHFSVLVNGGSRRLESCIMAKVALLSYGHRLGRLEKIVQWRGLDRMLLRSAARCDGYCRAEHLKMLSVLPVSERVALRAKRFERDQNRFVRLYALLVQLNYAPDKVADTIQNFGSTLGNLEFSQIVLLLRRKFIPSSVYGDFLSSEDKNLIMLGLYMIRIYCIETAATEVAQLIPNPDKAIRNAALTTLAVIGSPLHDNRIVTSVSLMGERGRRRFYRLVASQGYALHALSPYIDIEGQGELGDYLVSAVDGRKRKLVSW